MRLEPLARHHSEGLAAVVAEGGLDHAWYTSIPTPEGMVAEVSRRLSLRDAGQMNPWAIRRLADERLVGMTTFWDIDEENRRVEIGHTWLGVTAQRSAVNTEAKLLLLSHAFETLDAIAVEFRTHWHNHQSRAAIERLGAKQDGVLRNHRLGADGTLRDTVVYSVIASEWPTVRLGLRERLRR